MSTSVIRQRNDMTSNSSITNGTQYSTTFSRNNYAVGEDNTNKKFKQHPLSRNNNSSQCSNPKSLSLFGSGILVGCFLTTLIVMMYIPSMSMYDTTGSGGNHNGNNNNNRMIVPPPPNRPSSLKRRIGSNNNDPKDVSSTIVDATTTANDETKMTEFERSVQISTRRHRTNPPSDLVVHGSRSKYTPCPIEYQKKIWIDLSKDFNIHRAFRKYEWYASSDSNITKSEFQIVWRKMGKPKEEYTKDVQPWQRYSRIPGFRTALESKDGFIAGWRRYQQQYDPSNTKDLIYFIPETYRLTIPEERKLYQAALDKEKSSGNYRPWVLKNPTKNNGKGVSILAPNSRELEEAIKTGKKQDTKTSEMSKTHYIIQSYVCNELTWFHGQKFDLRFFWLVISVDPLIVLYQDGYVRVGGSQYNETDFQSTGQHLTNHGYRGVDNDEHVDNIDLWKRVQQHYDTNIDRLSTIIGPDTDPIQHVRNQIKEAIGSIGVAFTEDLSLFGRNDEFKGKNNYENLFAFYGADFIIDADLDVYFIEAQASPGMGQKQDFRIDVFRRLFRPMVRMLEEVYEKQVTDAKQNLLPIENLGDWEIVYVGDWHYKYDGYQRSKTKVGCTAPTTS